MYFKMAPKDPPTRPLPEMAAQMPQDDESQEDPSVAPEGSPQDEGGQDSPGSVDMSIAGYMGPEYGPFQCSNCVHFLTPNACHIVAGNIDPAGCCNLFTPGSENESAESPEQEQSEQNEVEPQEGEY